MHQKQGSDGLGFAACHGDGLDTAIVVHHRAVLATGVNTVEHPQRDRTVETPASYLPSADIVPLTPPPRVA